jgi:hypothetical protein
MATLKWSEVSGADWHQIALGNRFVKALMVGSVTGRPAASSSPACRPQLRTCQQDARGVCWAQDLALAVSAGNSQNFAPGLYL